MNGNGMPRTQWQEPVNLSPKRTPMSSRFISFACAVTVLALLLAACGGDAKKKADAKTTPPTPSKPQVSWFVDATNGSDTNTGSSAAPFKTITHALGVATTGEIVNVAPGTYNAALGEVFPLAVPAGVTLHGEETLKGAGTTPYIIQGAGLASGILEAALTAGAGSTVAGFKFVGVAPTGGDLGEVVYLTHDGVTFRNNTITGAVHAAIYVDGSSNHVIAGNNVSNNLGGGLGFVTSGSGSKIENNVFANNLYGVELDVLGGDLGGGPTGSVGGNQIYCSTKNDLFTTLVGTIYAANNAWDHNPPSTNNVVDNTVDIVNIDGATIIISGATVVAGNCP